MRCFKLSQFAASGADPHVETGRGDGRGLLLRGCRLL